MNLLRRLCAVGAVLTAVLALAGVAGAATFTVDSTGDALGTDAAANCAPGAAAGGCTLRSAVEAANASSDASDRIVVPAGTYVLAQGALDITAPDPVEIDGAGTGSTTIDAGGASRAFVVEADTTATLTNLSIANGAADGVLCSDSGTTGQHDGGAILQLGTLTLTQVAIENSQAVGSGGALADEGGQPLQISDSTITHNTTCADTGDAYNRADGGGVYENDRGQVTITRSIISDNSAPGGRGAGGGIAEEGGGQLTVATSTISGNTATAGAGVDAGWDAEAEQAGSVTLTSDTLSGNAAGSPVFSGPAAAHPGVVPTGLAPGGGLDNEGDTVSVTNSTVAGNSASDGGGLASASGHTTIAFSTITDNTAVGTAPMLARMSPADEKWGYGGNIEQGGGGTFSIDNSIVARGTAPAAGGFADCGGTGITSTGHNLFDDTADGGAQCGAGSSDLVTGVLGLGTLADNGGPTHTEALQAGSPAIDAAADAACAAETGAADQRGVARPQGAHCDIGAYEYEYADLALTASADPTSIPVGAQSSVTDVITNNGPSASAGVTFTDPASGGYTIASAAPSQGTCTHAATTVSCAIGTLAAGARAVVTIVLTGTAAGPVTLNSSVAASTPDPNPANNTASVAVTVVAPPSAPTTTPVAPPAGAGPSADLALTKSAAPGRLRRGRRTTFTLTVTNHGPSAATGVVLTDRLPRGLKWVSTSASQGHCSRGGHVRCSLGTLDSGHHATVTVVVIGERTGRIRNTGHIAATVTDPNPRNNTASATVIVTTPPCVQNLVFTTHWMASARVTTVKVYVDGQLRQTLHGSDLRRVKVKPLPAHGVHSVTVMFVIAPLETVAATRTYNGCSSGATTYSYPPQTNPGAS